MGFSLRERLIAFRAKYYRVQILRGIFLVGLWSVGCFVLFALSEGLFWWEVPVRLFLWAIWVGGSLFAVGRWILYPLLQYGLRLRGYLSDEEAARWIGRRLPEVRDKLLNALQLSRQDISENAAIALAIEERMRQLTVIPWELSLPQREVRRYALIFLLITAGAAGLWLASPTTFRGGTFRLLRPNQVFARPLPYTLSLVGIRPFYRQGEPLEAIILLSGEKLPAQLYAVGATGPLPLRRESPSRYALSLPAVQESFLLRIETEGQLLGSYPITVHRPPVLRNFTLRCEYPTYTRLAPDTLSQPIARVLYGSYLSVQFDIESERPYQLEAEGLSLRSSGATRWTGKLLAASSNSYALIVRDSLFSDTLRLTVEVYPDYHPSVQLFSEWFNAETWEQGLRMRLMDDFGFTRAMLWYRIAESPTPSRVQEQFRAKPLSISTEASQEKFYSIAWQSLGIQTGDKVEYYVEAWDNDALRGPKSSRSILYTLEPTNDAQKQEIFAQLQDSLLSELQKIHDKLKELASTSDLSRKLRETTALSEQFRSVRSELRALQRLAAEQQLYTPELLERMRQLEKVLESIDPQRPERLLSQLLQPQSDSLRRSQLQEELERAYREWEEKMARLEALSPQYQQERKLEELMTRLSELSERQQGLAKLPDSLQHQPGTQGPQERLLEETQQLRRQVDSLRQQTPESALRDSLGRSVQYLQDALKSMQKSLEQMQQGGSPQEAQQNAAQNLERALSAMDQGQQQAQSSQEAEEYEALRLLLKGILSLSFRQEEARKKAQESAPFLASAKPLVQEQLAIRRDYAQVQETLFALAGRSPVIEEAILDLLRDMDRYFRGLSFQEAEPLMRRQQYILQGLNRLANLMTELLAQLEENQRNRQQRAGGGACQRPFRVRRKGQAGQPSSSPQKSQGQSSRPQPGPKKEGQAPSLQQLQQQLNEALDRALQPNPASENPGGISPSERARLSAQQELIRLQLQERLRQSPGDAGQLQQLIEDMQKAEKEILGGSLTRDRLLRQQQILTRLLDYERSQREREIDPTRESRTAQQFFQRTTGIYPIPSAKPTPATSTPALWLYQLPYQRLIETYFQTP